jgi:ribosomal 50S subunit-recycling heat shock protein
MRVDVVLHNLCLTRSRNEAKKACEAGAVLVNGEPAKPSDSLHMDDLVALRFSRRVLEVRLVEIPRKALSKKAAREMYEIVRDEPTG